MNDGFGHDPLRHATNVSYWPTFVDEWPEAKMEVSGLTGRILKGEQGWVIFMVADRDVLIPMHHHGAQWGIVLDGEMTLTIGDRTTSYGRGESHYIPAGVDHEAFLLAGWRGMYVFMRPRGQGLHAGVD